MALTKEENDEINRIRYEIRNLSTAIEHIARATGAEPILLMDEPPTPEAGLPSDTIMQFIKTGSPDV